MTNSPPLTGVVQLIDRLARGGMERMAVELANHLPRERYRAYLCTTRDDGPLLNDLAPDVGYLSLRRRQRFDGAALRTFSSFAQTHRLDIVHAHGPALLMAGLASLIPPFPKVVWHCHSWHDLSPLAYFLLVRRAGAIIAVNEPIRWWINRYLRYPANRIWYVPNFSTLFDRASPAPLSPWPWPGRAGQRLVCVASLYPLKDQLTLVRAMALVRQQFPGAHLLLVGPDWPGAQYGQAVRTEIQQLGLAQHVTCLGMRADVAEILTGCDIGVLSSISEGLPVALLEYGLAGLGVVCTQVGQCAEVLDAGRAGLLVSPQDPVALAEALTSLLRNPRLRHQLGQRLQERIKTQYSLARALAVLEPIYQALHHGDWRLVENPAPATKAKVPKSDFTGANL